MYVEKETILGVCPIGKFVFSHEDAIVQKEKVYKKLDEIGVNYITIETVLQDGIVRSQEDAAAVIDHFTKMKITALFIPHCNFGTEGAAAMISKKLNVPVLLWGPRDGAPEPDGSRLRDTLCGLFATSGVLNKLGVVFQYIENCSVDDEPFAKGVAEFTRIANVVHKFRNIRIGLIGGRIDFFWTCIINENELLDKFGIQVVPFEMPIVIDGILNRARENKSAYEEELAAMDWLDTSGVPDKYELIIGLAERDELIRIAVENRLDALAVQGFTSLAAAVGSGAALGTALAAEEILIADESDIHGAISSIIINAASSSPYPNFFPEFVVRHPDREDVACLWHVGAPVSLKHGDDEAANVSIPWILPGSKPTSLQFRLRDGDITVCRFDGAQNKYTLGVGQCKTTSGPRTRDYYAWVQLDDWREWEKKLIFGPYIHHLSATYDRCADILVEAARYIPGLEIEIFGGLDR